jgi:hypothetical protein
MSGCPQANYHYVLYRNPEENESRVSSWPPVLAAYTAGTDYHISDFDIMNMRLDEPVDGGVLFRPYIFSWWRRWDTIGDVMR